MATKTDKLIKALTFEGFTRCEESRSSRLCFQKQVTLINRADNSRRETIKYVFVMTGCLRKTYDKPNFTDSVSDDRFAAYLLKQHGLN